MKTSGGKAAAVLPRSASVFFAFFQWFLLVQRCTAQAQLLKLVAEDGAAWGEFNQFFGHSVAVSSDGTRVVVGAVDRSTSSSTGSESGSAYLFDGATGAQLFKLVLENGTAGSQFGGTVAVSSDAARVVVGARWADGRSGAAYVFDGANGTRLYKLVAEDITPQAKDAASGANFGLDVAVSSDASRVVVGAAWNDDADLNLEDCGSAYVFDGATGAQLFKLKAEDRSAYDYFGNSVAVSSDGARVVVGAYYADNKQGSVYVFDGATGAQLLKLAAEDGAPHDWFGFSVAVSSDGARVVVGTLQDDDLGGNSGSAYLFDGATGARLHKLVAEDAAAGNCFGQSVAVNCDGTRVVAGAAAGFLYDGYCNKNYPGSAYVFDGTTGAQLHALVAQDGAANDSDSNAFGNRVAVSSDAARVVVASRGFTDAGSVYLFNSSTLAFGPATSCTNEATSSSTSSNTGIPEATSSTTSSTTAIIEATSPATLSTTATTETGASDSNRFPLTGQEQDSGEVVVVGVVVTIAFLFCGATSALVYWMRSRWASVGGRMREPAREVPQIAIQEPHSEDARELPRSMEFWFLPVDEIMRAPANEPLSRHQVWRDNGLLVKRTMDIEDVVKGNFVADTAAISHRWPVPEHFDPDGAKVQKLQEVLRDRPSIRFLWVDWVCAPQWHGGGRSSEEEVEFRLILENILPFIFLGCSVIVLYERIYQERFWPNVECWVATQMPTQDGLMPASEDRIRVRVHGMYSMGGMDEACSDFVFRTWHSISARQAVEILSASDIMVTNMRDKEINLRVVASLDEVVSHISRDVMSCESEAAINV